MRPPVKWLLTAALAAMIAAPAIAQFIPGMMPLLENGLQAPILLMNKGVQREIKLTDEQRDKFRHIVKEVHDKYQPEIQKARAARDNKKLLQVTLESTQATTDKVNKAIPDVLKPEQAKRLRQIEIQVNALIFLNKPDIQKKLDMKDKQKEEIARIGDGLKSDLAEVVKDAANGPLLKALEAARKAKSLSEEATRKALATLSSEQQKTWNEMTGDKFELKLDILSRPGGRPAK
jgi:Spy/CpxP family protein refolding chaperone